MSTLRFIALLLALLVSTTADAHQLWPSYLHLSQTDAHRVSVFWKVPVKAGTPLAIQPVLPAHCTELTPPMPISDGRSVRSSWQVDCGELGLLEQEIRIDGLAAIGSDVVVRLEDSSGRVSQGIVHPDTGTIRLTDDDAGSIALWRYLPIGMEHILLGADHLLFVLGLLLVIRLNWRQLLRTLTAFTLAHSLTLGLAVLGFVQFPQRAVEAIIALSIVFLAVEIARGATPEVSLTARRPGLVAGGCGLIHGLGFAGALSEIGLPADAVPGALLLFNLGVEAGQLLFVAAVGAVFLLLRRLPVPSQPLRLAASYLLGTTAAFWFLQRTLAILS
ncbi:MAG: hypothetical protein ACI8RZ_004533 [Myxococcota bacterium]|jgi:hypothetical protein